MASSTVVTAPVPALVVAALGAGVLAGCTAQQQPAPTPQPSGAAHPDAALLTAALRREQELLAAYDAVAAMGSTLAGVLTEARAHHVQHLDSIREAASRLGLPAETPTTAASPTSGPVPDATAVGLPGDPVTAARQLLAQERTSSATGIAAVHDVSDRDLGALLAQIAASESQHAAALFIAVRAGLVRRAVASPVPAASS